MIISLLSSMSSLLLFLHLSFLSFLHVPATTDLYTLSLHDALPIFPERLSTAEPDDVFHHERRTWQRGESRRTRRRRQGVSNACSGCRSGQPHVARVFERRGRRRAAGRERARSHR